MKPNALSLPYASVLQNYNQIGHEDLMNSFAQMGVPSNFHSDGSWHGKPQKTSTMQYELGGRKVYAASTTIVDTANLVT
jgi:hypothetical protein